MALTPGTFCGKFYKRKDGTMVKYKGTHVEATVPKAMEKPMKKAITVTHAEAIASTSARIIAVPPCSRFGRYYKRKDGTIQRTPKASNTSDHIGFASDHQGSRQCKLGITSDHRGSRQNNLGFGAAIRVA